MLKGSDRRLSIRIGVEGLRNPRRQPNDMIGNHATLLKESRVHTLLRVVLGIIFLWASWEKIIYPAQFADVVDAYRILPSPTVNFVALLLPWVEALCGIFLITGYLVQGSVLLVDMLMLVFILAGIISLYRGVDVTCGTFSLVAEAGGKMYAILARNAVILLMGLVVLIYEIKNDHYTNSGLPRM